MALDTSLWRDYIEAGSNRNWRKLQLVKNLGEELVQQKFNKVKQLKEKLEKEKEELLKYAGERSVEEQPYITSIQETGTGMRPRLDEETGQPIDLNRLPGVNMTGENPPPLPIMDEWVNQEQVETPLQPLDVAKRMQEGKEVKWKKREVPAGMERETTRTKEGTQVREKRISTLPEQKMKLQDIEKRESQIITTLKTFGDSDEARKSWDAIQIEREELGYQKTPYPLEQGAETPQSKAIQSRIAQYKIIYAGHDKSYINNRIDDLRSDLKLIAPDAPYYVPPEIKPEYDAKKAELEVALERQKELAGLGEGSKKTEPVKGSIEEKARRYLTNRGAQVTDANIKAVIERFKDKEIPE